MAKTKPKIYGIYIFQWSVLPEVYLYNLFFPFSNMSFCHFLAHLFVSFFFMTCQVGLRHGKFGYGIEVSKATALAIYGCGTLARG